MTTFDDIEEKARRHGALCMLNEQQAGALIGKTSSALKKSRETKRRAADGSASVPFVRTGGRGVSYALTDLLEFAKKHNSNGLTAAQRTLAILMGEDFCKSIGEPYPATTLSKAGAPAPSRVSMTSMPGLAQLLGGVSDASSEEGNQSRSTGKRGPKPRKAEWERQELLKKSTGNAVEYRWNICKFATLYDFLTHAEPDDEWLFCCPPDRRPYDFIAAIIEGPTEALFVWMSLTEYLNALGTWSATDRDARKSREEGKQIGECLAPPKKPKKVVQRRPKTPDGRL